LQPQRKTCDLATVSKAALGGLLALLLLVASALSVSHELHQAAHPQGSANAHLCLLCSLAKGQVSVAAAGPIFAAVVFCFLFRARLTAASPGLSAERSPSQSRAPPRS